MEKVDSASERDGIDWCEFEFSAALLSQGKRSMIAVVMEKELLNPVKSNGMVKSALGSSMFVDYSRDDLAETAARLLGEEVIKRGLGKKG